MSIIHWVKAARLRTLPLAASVIGSGSLVAYASGTFHIPIAIWCLVTTLGLQILSNFANDLGDALHGADHSERGGPARMVQVGLISKTNMTLAVVSMALFSFLSGLWLLYLTYQVLSWSGVLFFLILGILCILAALFYTLGKRPYGYLALGDLSVFVFFGIVGVLGSAYLISAGALQIRDVLPAISMGCFSTAVLHLNNMRDILSDTMAGKRTVAIYLGYATSKYYLYALVWGGIIAGFIYVWALHHTVLLLTAPAYFMIQHVMKPLAAYTASDRIDALLPKMALLTVAFTAVMILSVLWL